MLQNTDKVVLSNIGLSYGSVVIYDGFNAVFESGVNVVLGRSGSGKTSLLNVIAGLVEYSGECLSPSPSAVFSEPSLSPISVENNIKLILGKKQCVDQVEEALKTAKIYDKRKQNASTLSDGEKQRVSLARAFASGRKLMLLDEPFSRLDYGVKKQLYDTLIDYLSKTEVTVIMVTHDIDEALTLADRIYFLDGRPCKLTQIAALNRPQTDRDIYDGNCSAIREQLQRLFTIE